MGVRANQSASAAPAFPMIRGRMAAGMPSASRMPACQARARRSMRRVRDALVQSVTWTAVWG